MLSAAYLDDWIFLVRVRLGVVFAHVGFSIVLLQCVVPNPESRGIESLGRVSRNSKGSTALYLVAYETNVAV